MSLKINESAQEKVRSLSDLFGDNLTDAGKADLEWAAECAAQDLAMLIFSESEPVITNSSENSEQRLLWHTAIARAASHSHSNYDDGNSYATNEYRNYRHFGMFKNAINPPTQRGYPEYKDLLKTGVYAFIPHMDKYGNLISGSEDNVHINLLFANVAHNLKNICSHQSLLEDRHHQITELNEIKGIKTMTVKLQETGGPEYMKVIPQQLKADQKMILPKMKKTVLLGHKAK
ncbi:hypothetical protein [Leclercia adecarboxylata]|uniref:hypothetical protein n=1 Tax=Leclercia adecarboxylata TaxID=83655 RepID=UPI0038504EDA